MCERYFKAGAEQCDLLDRRELFSFGSGSFYDGQDAVELIDSNAGTFISCNLNFSTLIVMDRKKTQGHLATLGCLDKAVTLRELLQALEDKGEATSHETGTHCQHHIKSVSHFTPCQVNVGFSHHSVDLANDSIQSEKRLCFVLDPVKKEEPPKKRRKKEKKEKAVVCDYNISKICLVLVVDFVCFPAHENSTIHGYLHLQVSAVTFGSKLDVKKLVDCRALAIAWRVRRLTSDFFLIGY